MTLEQIANSQALKGLVADFLISAGLALSGIAVGTWSEAQAAASVVTFVIVKSALLAGVRAPIGAPRSTTPTGRSATRRAITPDRARSTTGRSAATAAVALPTRPPSPSTRLTSGTWAGNARPVASRSTPTERPATRRTSSASPELS